MFNLETILVWQKPYNESKKNSYSLMKVLSAFGVSKKISIVFVGISCCGMM